MSEKVPMITTLLVSFITGFVLAYARSWRLALAISSILPAMAVVGAIMNIFMAKCTKSSLQHIADSGTLAEEAISTVRTAQAFGIQSTLAEIYDTHVNQSKKVETRSAILQGVGIAVFFFVIYAAYGLAFSFGATLINQGHGQCSLPSKRTYCPLNL
jgi:ATP-binding cassette subfamily B (MDR/TAP) protein 1